jgi:hypothetical protein
MIVLPRLVNDLLRSANIATQKSLALDFADHRVVAGRHLHLPAIFLDYLNAARSYVIHECGIGSVAEKHADFYRSWTQDEPLHGIGQIVRLAVLVGCQREMEEAGVLVPTSYVPDVTVVARDAQIAAGRWPAPEAEAATPPSKSPEKYRQWEEARWQLHRIIELLPNPHYPSEPFPPGSSAPISN